VRADAAPHRRGLGPATLAAYAAGLAEVAREPGVLRLVNDHVDRAVGRLELLLDAAGDPEPDSGGSTGTSPVIGR
jgi:F420-dependent methylenetetrahydromethanopterin dehydrogenase